MFSLILLLLTRGSPALTAAAPSCYYASGQTAKSNPGKVGLVPCDPAIEVSNCCTETDLCLGNGLCLGLNANNALTFQGCTRPDWPKACSHGFEWPFRVMVAQYPYVWPCRFGFNTPYCVGENASCCADEDNWVYLPKFSNIHLAGNTDYIIHDTRSTVDNIVADATLSTSDRIALGVGIGLPFVAILVALGQWLFPNAPLWLWKRRREPTKLKQDDDEVRTKDERKDPLLPKFSGLEMAATGDLGEMRYKDDIQHSGSEKFRNAEAGYPV
ncbi:hypothetical protein F4860DRAFT_287263 [Xylaria cubensis]|nr:hypothetical protein F4860DRAFT_287263 [Xylaria cubensis]